MAKIKAGTRLTRTCGRAHTTLIATLLGPCACLLPAGAAWGQSAPTSDQRPVPATVNQDEPPATGQDNTRSASSPSPAVGAGTARIEDIVVTASRYSQTLQTTPLAVSALSANSLQARGVVDVADLATEVPNLQIGTNGANSSVDISVRGITANNANAYSGNPAVASYVNGVYVPRTQGLNEALFDVERVEVLRGPQGTLYGRNSTAGAVNIITAKPTQSFGLGADLTYGNYNTVQSHLLLNLPATDTLAFRGVFFSNRDDGYQDTRGATRNNYFRANQFGGRLSALWQPTDKLSVLLESDYYNDTGSPNLGVATPVPNTIYATQLAPDPYRPLVTPGQDGTQRIAVFNVRTNVDYAFTDTFSVSYIGGYGTVRLNTFTDDDGTLSAFSTANFDDREWNTSHEIDLRYTSPTLKLVVGGNYTYERDSGDLLVEFLQATGRAPQQLQFPHPDFLQRNFGIFGQGTYSVSDKLRLTGGVRYSNDYVEGPNAGTLFCARNTPNYASIDTPGCTRYNPYNYAPRKFTRVNWKAGVDFDIAPRSLLYGSVSTGYKQGTLNAASATFTSPVVQPESVTNYEVGTKNRFADGTVTLNASLFYVKYKNLQVQQVVFQSINPPVTTNVTTNAARASIYGAEVEGVWKITAADQISGFVSYLHARYDQFLNANDPITDPNNLQPLDLSGNRLIRSPDFSARVSYNHDFELSGGGKLTPQISFFYQTAAFLREFNRSFDRQGGYTKTDLRLTYEMPGAHWTVEGFVQNLEDKAVRVAEYAASSYLLSYYAPPRRFGVRVAYKY